jgi:hypothetical protein
VGSELEHAWQAALAAHGEDRAPWRVLADVLTDRGDQRGEWLQLELDAEEGRLKGLARGRLQQLRHGLVPRVVPPGVDMGSVRLWRTLFVAGRAQVSTAREAADPRWGSVRHLGFFIERRTPTAAQWGSTPLARALPWLESLAELEEEGLQLLGQGLSFPRLRRVWALWRLGRARELPVATYDALWSAVFARQPALREVHVGWAGPVRSAAPYLEGLLARGLERLGVEGSPDDVVEFDAWVRGTGFRGEFVVELRRQRLRRATVLVGRDALLLRCQPRVADEARESLQQAFRDVGRAPAVRVEAALEGWEQLPPPV